MIVEVIHPGLPNVPTEDLKTKLAAKYKTDAKNVIVYGLRTAFGGGRSQGFCLIYDNFDYLMKYSPKFRLRRLKVIEDRHGNRKQRKELKTKRSKVRGTKKNKIQAGKKK